MSITQAFGDAQTTITCLAGGVAGATSDALGSVVVGRFNTGATPGIGAVGLEFCARAVISAGVFGCVHGYMPETSGNIFFSILYFACDRGLMSSAVGLSRAAVNAVSGTMRATATPTKGKSTPVPPANPTAIMTGCGSGSCN